MLRKRMEWTVRRFDTSCNLQSFFSSQNLSLALQQADEWKEFYGERARVKIQRRLVAGFTNATGEAV